MDTVPQQSAIPAAPVAQPVVQPAAPAQPEQATSAVVLPPAAPAAPADVVPAKARRPRRDSPANGLTSSQVSSVPAMRSIWKDHYEKGISYEKIEEIEKYGLRRAKGMTAYRLCRKYEAASGTKRPTAK